MSKNSEYDLLLLFIAVSIVWFVSAGSIFILIFSSSIMITVYLMLVIQTIYSFGNDSRIVIEQLMEINEKLREVNASIDTFKPQHSFSYDFLDYPLGEEE